MAAGLDDQHRRGPLFAEVSTHLQAHRAVSRCTTPLMGRPARNASAQRDVSDSPLQASACSTTRFFIEADQALGRTFAGEKGSDDQKAAKIFSSV